MTNKEPENNPMFNLFNDLQSYINDYIDTVVEKRLEQRLNALKPLKEPEFIGIKELSRLTSIPETGIKRRMKLKKNHRDYIKHSFQSNKYLIHKDEVHRLINGLKEN